MEEETAAFMISTGIDRKNDNSHKSIVTVGQGSSGSGRICRLLIILKLHQELCCRLSTHQTSEALMLALNHDTILSRMCRKTYKFSHNNYDEQNKDKQ